jgi:hypothetical protein
LYAYVLLVSVLLFPASVKGFYSRGIKHPGSDEAQKLQQLWKEMKASDYWGRFIYAARDEDIKGLREMREVVTMLDSEPLAEDVPMDIGMG